MDQDPRTSETSRNLTINHRCLAIYILKGSFRSHHERAQACLHARASVYTVLVLHELTADCVTTKNCGIVNRPTLVT